MDKTLHDLKTECTLVQTYLPTSQNALHNITQHSPVGKNTNKILSKKTNIGHFKDEIKRKSEVGVSWHNAFRH